MRFALYTLVSFLATAINLTYAWQTRVQFYPIVIFLVTSKASILVLSNLFLNITILFGKFLKTIFLGPLRDREVEVLWENSRFAITNTCLALTIFREELGVREAILFVMLIFSKIFHWVCRKRVEFMEGREDVVWKDHLRIVALKGTLLASDLTVVAVAVYMTRTKGPTVWILFGFEYLCMAVLVSSTFVRYLLFLRHLMSEGEWNERETYSFYLELITDVINLTVYLAFFLIIFTYYGVPLHIVRDLYISFRNLTRRIQECCRTRSLTSRLDEVLESATSEQLQDEPLCIVCREAMTVDGNVKVLPCGHIFHLHCLQHWIRHQAHCPVCRSALNETALRAAAAARERQALAGIAEVAANVAMAGQVPVVEGGEGVGRGGEGGGGGGGGGGAEAAAAAGHNAFAAAVAREQPVVVAMMHPTDTPDGARGAPTPTPPNEQGGRSIMRPSGVGRLPMTPENFRSFEKWRAEQLGTTVNNLTPMMSPVGRAAYSSRPASLNPAMMGTSSLPSPYGGMGSTTMPPPSQYPPNSMMPSLPSPYGGMGSTAMPPPNQYPMPPPGMMMPGMMSSPGLGMMGGGVPGGMMMGSPFGGAPPSPFQSPFGGVPSPMAASLSSTTTSRQQLDVVDAQIKYLETMLSQLTGENNSAQTGGGGSSAPTSAPTSVPMSAPTSTPTPRTMLVPKEEEERKEEGGESVRSVVLTTEIATMVPFVVPVEEEEEVVVEEEEFRGETKNGFPDLTQQTRQTEEEQQAGVAPPPSPSLQDSEEQVPTSVHVHRSGSVDITQGRSNKAFQQQQQQQQPQQAAAAAAAEVTETTEAIETVEPTAEETVEPAVAAEPAAAEPAVAEPAAAEPAAELETTAEEQNQDMSPSSIRRRKSAAAAAERRRRAASEHEAEETRLI